jgi:hypothetical protein
LNRRHFVAPALLAAALLASVIVYQVSPQPLERVLLFFPDTAGGSRHAEWHFVPRRSDPTDRIEVFIDELRLGPVEIGSVPFIPESADVRSIVVDSEGVLYIDFTPDIMFDESDSERNFADLEQLLTENLRHNFRNLQGTVVLIGGQVPNAPSFGEISR